MNFQSFLNNWILPLDGTIQKTEKNNSSTIFDIDRQSSQSSNFPSSLPNTTDQRTIELGSNADIEQPLDSNIVETTRPNIITYNPINEIITTPNYVITEPSSIYNVTSTPPSTSIPTSTPTPNNGYVFSPHISLSIIQPNSMNQENHLKSKHLHKSHHSHPSKMKHMRTTKDKEYLAEMPENRKNVSFNGYYDVFEPSPINIDTDFKNMNCVNLAKPPSKIINMSTPAPKSGYVTNEPRRPFGCSPSKYPIEPITTTSPATTAPDKFNDGMCTCPPKKHYCKYKTPRKTQQVLAKQPEIQLMQPTNAPFTTMPSLEVEATPTIMTTMPSNIQYTTTPVITNVPTTQPNLTSSNPTFASYINQPFQEIPFNTLSPIMAQPMPYITPYIPSMLAPMTQAPFVTKPSTVQTPPTQTPQQPPTEAPQQPPTETPQQPPTETPQQPPTDIPTNGPNDVVDCSYTMIMGPCDPVTGKSIWTPYITIPAKNGGAECPPFYDNPPIIVNCTDTSTPTPLSTPTPGVTFPPPGVFTLTAPTYNVQTTPPYNVQTTTPYVTTNPVTQPPVDCSWATAYLGCDPTTQKQNVYTWILSDPKYGGMTCPPMSYYHNTYQIDSPQCVTTPPIISNTKRS